MLFSVMNSLELNSKIISISMRVPLRSCQRAPPLPGGGLSLGSTLSRHSTLNTLYLSLSLDTVRLSLSLDSFFFSLSLSLPLSLSLNTRHSILSLSICL